MVGVSPVSYDEGFGQPVDRQRVGPYGDDGLHVGGIPRFDAPHVGVLADLALGQELLRRAAAHRPGDRRDDDVANCQAGEDASGRPRGERDRRP